MVYLPAFALQQDLQTAVAEPAPSFGQLAQPHPQSLVLAPPPSIPTRRTIEFHQPAGAAATEGGGYFVTVSAFAKVKRSEAYRDLSGSLRLTLTCSPVSAQS